MYVCASFSFLDTTAWVLDSRLYSDILGEGSTFVFPPCNNVNYVITGKQAEDKSRRS